MVSRTLHAADLSEIPGEFVEDSFYGGVGEFPHTAVDVGVLDTDSHI